VNNRKEASKLLGIACSALRCRACLPSLYALADMGIPETERKKESRCESIRDHLRWFLFYRVSRVS
jgi:hypothetical protein